MFETKTNGVDCCDIHHKIWNMYIFQYVYKRQLSWAILWGLLAKCYIYFTNYILYLENTYTSDDIAN